MAIRQQLAEALVRDNAGIPDADPRAQVAGSSTDVEGVTSVRAPPHLSDLERRKGKERQRRQSAHEEHIKSYQAVDVLNRPARLETLDLGRLNMLSGTA